jgi:hypothetical protein
MQSSGSAGPVCLRGRGRPHLPLTKAAAHRSCSTLMVSCLWPASCTTTLAPSLPLSSQRRMIHTASLWRSMYIMYIPRMWPHPPSEWKTPSSSPHSRHELLGASPHLNLWLAVFVWPHLAWNVRRMATGVGLTLSIQICIAGAAVCV